MAFSGRRQFGIRLLLRGTRPLCGFVLDDRATSLNRRHYWHYDGKRLIGGFPPALHAELLGFVRQLAAQAKVYEERGRSAFLKFSGVEKIGGASWSLPAIAACPLIDESCVDCYALAGFYHANTAAQVGRVMRFEYLKSLIERGDLGPWFDWMVGALNGLRPSTAPGEVGQRFFRWHDSGDVFHPAYASAILDICHATPDVSHWLPTRVGPLQARVFAKTDSFPANLSITVSSVRGGRYEERQRRAVTRIRERHPDAKVTLTFTDQQGRASLPDRRQLEQDYGEEMAVCPVTIQPKGHKRSCEGCRRCWQASPGPTIYVVQAPGPIPPHE